MVQENSGALKTADYGRKSGEFFVWFYLYMGSAFTVVTADKGLLFRVCALFVSCTKSLVVYLKSQ